MQKKRKHVANTIYYLWGGGDSDCGKILKNFCHKYMIEGLDIEKALP